MSRARDLSDFISTGALTDGSLDIADVDGLQAAIDGKEAADSTILKDADIGTDVQAYNTSLTAFLQAVALPSIDGSVNQILKTNGAGVMSFTDMPNETNLIANATAMAVALG